MRKPRTAGDPINGFVLNAFALDPIPHSRSTLVAVVVAHVAAGLLAVQLFEARRYIDPAPLMVDLLQAPAPPEEKVDSAPVPLPQAPEPVPEVKPEPEPVKPEPILREEPKPIERVLSPEPAPEIAPPPVIEPPVPTPPPPMPEPVVAAPEPSPITVPVPPAPVEPAPVAEPEIPEITMTAQMLTAAYRSNPKPSYPGASRRLGEQGTVFLRVFVTADGDPARIELKSSSGFPRLDKSAQDAVHRWKFEPARRGERPVDAWVVVPIKFSLKG
jgi:protein TonB